MTPTDDRSEAVQATRLTLPIQLALALVAGSITTTIAVTCAFWLITSTMRTDIAVIRQVQIDQSKIDDYKTKLEEANRQVLQQSIDALKGDVSVVRGQVQLANIEIGNVRREMNDRMPGGRR